MSTVFLRNEANLAAVIGTTKIACKVRQEQTGEFVLPDHVMAFEDPKSGALMMIIPATVEKGPLAIVPCKQSYFGMLPQHIEAIIKRHGGHKKQEAMYYLEDHDPFFAKKVPTV